MPFELSPRRRRNHTTEEQAELCRGHLPRNWPPLQKVLTATLPAAEKNGRLRWGTTTATEEASLRPWLYSHPFGLAKESRLQRRTNPKQSVAAAVHKRRLLTCSGTALRKLHGSQQFGYLEILRLSRQDYCRHQEKGKKRHFKFLVQAFLQEWCQVFKRSYKMRLEQLKCSIRTDLLSELRYPDKLEHRSRDSHMAKLLREDNWGWEHTPL